MPKCPKCGTEVKAKDEFCLQCGSKIKSEENNNRQTEKKLPSKPTKAVLIIILVVIFFIAAALIILTWGTTFSTGIQKSTEATTEEQEQVQQISEQEKGLAKEAIGIACVDQCGDNTCDTNVCMAAGCPCSENYRTCPSDCHEARFADLANFAKDSECLEKGELTDEYAFNPETRTWWINMKMNPEFEIEGCSPACVIYEDEDKVELNWRCTGAIVVA